MSLATSLKQVELYPLMTEKGVDRQGKNQALFRVNKNATKYTIALAVEALYNVKPLSIRTAQMKPKNRRRGATIGKTNAWKKAYVTVPDIKALNLVP